MRTFPWAMELEFSEVESGRARRFCRVPFDAPVRLTRHSTGQVLELQASNLSEGGLFVETVIPFAPGELFRLEMPGAPSGFDTVAVAKVCWRRPFSLNRSPGLPPGIGLMFLLMRPSDRQALHELVEDGGIAPSPRPATRPARSAPLPATVEPSKLPAVAPPPPQLRWRPVGVEDTTAIDVAPFGGLLAIALALAAMASLLVGLQPPHP